MNRRRILALSAVTTLAFALSAGNVVAQLAKDVVGSWTIVSAGDAYGPTPKGSLIFEPNGLAARWRKIKAYWKLYPFSY